MVFSSKGRAVFRLCAAGLKFLRTALPALTHQKWNVLLPSSSTHNHK